MNKHHKHNKTGYTLPDNYFKTIEGRVFASISEAKNKESRSFKVPQNYFEEVEHTILNNLQFHKSSTKSASTNYWKLAAIAAIIIIAISVVNYHTTQAVAFENLKMASIEHYFEDNYLDFDDEDLHALIEEGTEFSLNLNEAALFEYLDNSIEDPTLLID